MAKEPRLREEDITLEWGDLKLCGSSRAGYRTHIGIKALNLVFDLGQCSQRDAGRKHILLTHVHMDHSLGVLRSIALRDMMGLSRPKIYLPADHCDAFREVVRAYDKLEGKNRDHDDLFVPVRDGDQFNIGKGIEVSVFGVRHTVKAVGFRLSRTKHVLKDEFRDLTGPEIGEKVRSGVQVKRPITENLMTYIGDAQIESLDDHPEVLKSRMLILECTYVEKKDRELARPRGHIHIDDIAERAEQFDCEVLVLKHFSLKYSLQQIEELVMQGLPESLYKRTRLLL